MSLSQTDLAVLTAMRTRGHSRPLERAIATYSRAGEHAACWFVLAAVGTLTERDRERRARWLRGARIVAGAYGLNYAVKVAVRRRRPELPGLRPLTPTVSRLSFPSAHATSSFAAAYAFRELVPAGALYLAASAFAVSRPYLGVHFPSDVIAGAVLGTAVAAAWPAEGAACR
ncbi:MAG: phosphatase PAP2 family protein [Solirubrobacteraceae bacterium]